MKLIKKISRLYFFRKINLPRAISSSFFIKVFFKDTLENRYVNE